MKILNLYAGIGGNRKLWGDEHEIIAVENNPEIAEVYKSFFPKDKVIIGDAQEQLLLEQEAVDFIWASPPCQSHSGCNHFLKGQGIYRYPDMRLWQVILFLKHFFDGKYVVENVKSYYTPMIEAQTIGRHYFWSNFSILPKEINYTQIGTMNRNASKDSQRKAIIREAQIPKFLDLHGLKDFKLKNKRQVLRNCVYPELGKHILDCAMGAEIKTEDLELF